MGFVAFTTLASGSAKSVDHDQADAQALDLAKQAIALRSVRGPGNQAPQVAALFKSALVAGGFNNADVTITPVDDTAFLIARWKGHDPKLKPLVVLGHMDVVEAKPSDWERDPFTPVVENGLLYWAGVQRHEAGRRVGSRRAHRTQTGGLRAATRSRSGALRR